MTQHTLLSNTEHRDLRVVTARGAAYGDDVMYSLTFPAEFRSVQANYPIVFGRSRDGTYTPLALFGFREKQNLFLVDGRWDAPYLPMMIDRQPFLIGASTTGKVVHIDLDHPRVSRTEGERVFDDLGGNTEYLKRAGSMLAAIDEGVSATPAFITAIQEYNLLESFALDIAFSDGTKHRFAGFHTIQEDRLRQLGPDALGKLHSHGYLQAVFMVIASLSNFRELIERASRLDVSQR
ncbi:MAG TPA: SapC family protein [Steroidobacteraceae bacterium]|nr:SapC family protein [Steroidobacteraceae bacterium]